MIGILTLVSADNCGSLLQAYALQTFLRKELHCDAELIPFAPQNARKMYRVFHPSVFKHGRSAAHFFLSLNSLFKQKSDYNAFRKCQLELPQVFCRNNRILWDYCCRYDTIVVGSDQVWNVNMFDFDPAYFLNGFAKRKVSYAASLGGQEKEEIPAELYKYRDALNRLDSISVREPQGKRILERLTSSRVSVCLDPTLLLDASIWESLAGERIVSEDYIFFYSYNYGDPVLNQIMADCAKRLRLPVYVINASRWIKQRPSEYGFRLCQKGGPLAFLSLMRHARYTFAQSLHGTIFATIFKTDFWFLNGREQDVLDQRSENILSLLNVRHRVIRPDNVMSVDLAEPLAYHENEQLRKLKTASVDYLRKALAL